MGRLIDADEIEVNRTIGGMNDFADCIRDSVQTVLDNAPTVEAIPKADYEARLKADLVAMLEDLKQDLIAESYGIETDCSDYVVNVADIDKVIQEKINALRGE